MNEQLQKIGEEYIKLLLESYGCQVVNKGIENKGHTLEIWYPKGFKKVSTLIRTIDDSSKTVSLLIARVINRRKIPLVVDYHLIKICGVEGAYSLDDTDLQQILLDSEKCRVYENEGSLFAEFSVELLVEKAMRIEEKKFRPHQPLSHVKPIEKVKPVDKVKAPTP
jgi:hypothetical protein